MTQSRVLLCLLLAGCAEDFTTAEQIIKADKLCAHHGGLDSINNYTGSAYCKDGVIVIKERKR